MPLLELITLYLVFAAIAYAAGVWLRELFSRWIDSEETK